jgi:nanoRNase/pAp phosphatase (c-di-AMP/oligoRNAs hydrolase)
MTQDHLDLLLQAVRGASRILILPHNDPDPDSIASAVALGHLFSAKLGLESSIGYRGIIGRAENRALVHYLGHPLHRLTGSDLRDPVSIVLVDTQLGTGNNPLPPGTSAAVVVDHHPRYEADGVAIFEDVRPDVGATSTILTEYFQAAGIDPPPRVATALLYGIRTDTLGLIRNTSPADVAAYFYLQSLCDDDALMEIEHAQLPVEYFQKLDTALHTARVYDGVVISYVGLMDHPDLAAEMADLLLRLKGIQWVLCMGAYKSELILALRTRNRRGGAGRLVRAVVAEQGMAGGHGTMAASHVPLEGAEAEELAREMGRRVLAHLNVSPRMAGRPILDGDG